MHLVRRVSGVDQSPMLNKAVYIPVTIPSNKENYLRFRSRQRTATKRHISEENEQLFKRISTAPKTYDRQKLSKQWNETLTYRKNISKA